MMTPATVMHPAAQAGALKERSMWWRNERGEEVEFFITVGGSLTEDPVAKRNRLILFIFLKVCRSEGHDL